MTKHTVAYYFKKLIKDMPNELNTMKELNAYVKKALKEAEKSAEDASWRTLFMSYEQFCYAFDYKEDNNCFKRMYPDCYADDSYEVEMRYMENPYKVPGDCYNRNCHSYYEMRFEYKNPKNQKNYRLKKKSFYNSSSEFALFLCNWDDVWEREESDSDDEINEEERESLYRKQKQEEEEEAMKRAEEIRQFEAESKMLEEKMKLIDKEKKKEETKTKADTEDAGTKIKRDAKKKYPNDASAQLRYIIEKDGKRLADTYGIHFG